MRLRCVPTTVVATVAMALLLPAAASAAALVPLAPSSSWKSSPVAVASPPGDPRVFVVERGNPANGEAAVRIVEDGVLLPTPFLTVANVDTDGERGLLSIAFAPDYSSSGLFYVFTVAKGPDAFGGAKGDLRVVEYRRSTANPDLADPGSARLVLAQSHSGASNHNGGQLAFGPDGYLYVTMGDAANGANAQDLSNDLGKILRIDPRGGTPFAVPPSNPFVGTVGARPEIYALGLRNPFRFSFAPNGDLVLPDVGNAKWEEVNLGKATGTAAATTLAGANLGWPNCEGACPSPNPLYVDPIFQYGHEPLGETTGCAIIGGYVVRDLGLSGLTGRYLYGDLCREDLRTLDLGAAGADPRPAGLSLPAGGGGPLGFGEDGRGCVYVATVQTVYRVAASADAAPACPERTAGGSPSAAGPTRDTSRPRLSLGGVLRQRLRRALRIFASCDEACSLRASAVLRLAGPGAGAAAAKAPLVTRRRVGAGKRVRLAVRLRRGARLRAEGALSNGLRVSALVAVTATDLSGNSSHRSVRIKLRPAR